MKPKIKINLFKHWYGHIFRMTCYKQNLDKHGKDKEIGTNIYGKNKQRMADFVKRQHRIHKWMKGVIIVPGLYLLKKFFGKYLEKQVPQDKQFEKLRILEKSFQEAILDWVECMLMQVRRRPNETVADRIEGNLSVECLNTIKDMALTVAINDTAYLEFLNMLMLRITVNMNKEYQGQVDHLIYCCKYVNDVRYFKLLQGGSLELEISGKKFFVPPQVLNAMLKEEMKRYGTSESTDTEAKD